MVNRVEIWELLLKEKLMIFVLQYYAMKELNQWNRLSDSILRR
jgi:hypothetical protein